MKKDTKYIDGEKLLGIIENSGLKVKTQAGFVKVIAAAGRIIYIPRTKKVARVFVAGFEIDGIDGIVKVGQNGHGSVKQTLEFSLLPDDDTTQFSMLLERMKELPPREKEKRSFVPKELRVKREKIKRPDEVDEVESHIKFVERVASEMGVQVSPKVYEARKQDNMQTAIDTNVIKE